MLKKILTRVIVLLLVFAAGVVVFSHIRNQEDTVEAVVSLVSTKGAYTNTNQFTVDACVTIILKVVMEVELLIPSYGYSAIPPCQEYTQEVCAGFFELPVFPQ